MTPEARLRLDQAILFAADVCSHYRIQYSLVETGPYALLAADRLKDIPAARQALKKHGWRFEKSLRRWLFQVVKHAEHTGNGHRAAKLEAEARRFGRQGRLHQLTTGGTQ